MNPSFVLPISQSKTDLESLMHEFLPNVSEDFVRSFILMRSVFLFENIFLFRLLGAFLPVRSFYLMINFSDGSVVKYEVTKKQFDYWQDKIEGVNSFLSRS